MGLSPAGPGRQMLPGDRAVPRHVFADLPGQVHQLPQLLHAHRRAIARAAMPPVPGLQADQRDLRPAATRGAARGPAPLPPA